MSGSARKEMNDQRITKIVSGKMDGTVFARVTKMVGGRLVRAVLDCAGSRQEILVRIPGGFKRRGATPITTSAIVSVFVGNDFDPKTDKLLPTDRFDLVAILGHKQASFLQKEGTIPEWMMSEIASDTSDTGAGFEFECEEGADELFTHAEIDDDEGVDIDRI